MKKAMAIKVRLDSEVWDSETLRSVCTRNGYYDAGSKEYFEEMLEYANNNPPTLEHIAVVSRDIFEHTKKNVSFELVFNVIANYGVIRVYDIQEVK